MSKAIKLAQLVDSDKADMQQCVSDLMRNSKLDKDTATKVALALRSKYLPKVANELGMSMEELNDLLIDNDFISDQQNINYSNDDENEALASNGSDNELVDEIGTNDDTNAKLSSNYHFDNVKKIVAEALSDPLFAEFVKNEDEFELDLDQDNEAVNENERVAQKNSNRNETEQNINKRGNTKMDAKELKTRQARRESLIRKAEQILNSSKAPFEHAQNKQLNVDRKHEKMTMESSDGNSLKKDTEEFASAAGKAVVPTTNPAEDFLLRDDYDLFKFDSSPDGGLEYTLPKDMFDLEIPATNVNVGDDFKVPTQLGNLSRKTTIAQHEVEDTDMDMDDEETDSLEPDMKEFNIELSDHDSDDLADESEGASPADNMLSEIDSMDDESLNEFLSGFKEWADANDIDLSGAGDEEMPDDMDHADELPEDDNEDMEPMESEEDMPMDSEEMSADMPNLDREAVASVLGPDFSLDEAEDVLYDTLVKAGIDPEEISKLTYAQGVKLAHKIITSQSTEVEDNRPMRKITLSDDEEECPECGNPMDECDCEEHEASNKNKTLVSSQEYTKKVEAMEKEAAIREARLKTAYDIWSKLAMYGMIPTEDVSANVDTWMEEGLSVKAMVNQGNIMLSTASNQKTKTATAGVQFGAALATTPAFSSVVDTSTKRPALIDLRGALKGIFTMPKIDKEETLNGN